MVDEGGHFLMSCGIGGRAIGGGGGTVGGRGGLGMVESLGLGMVNTGLRLVDVVSHRGGGDMVNWVGCVVNRRVVAIARGGVTIALLPGVERDLGDGDGVTRDQWVAEIVSIKGFMIHITIQYPTSARVS